MHRWKYNIKMNLGEIVCEGVTLMKIGSACGPEETF
jgi:hypothetical protein